MAKTVANTDALRSAGNTIVDIASQFQSEYRALLDSAKNTQQGWQADDNTEFVNKVVALEDDFAKLYQLLYGCGNDLKEAASTYEENVSTVKGIASSLATDI